MPVIFETGHLTAAKHVFRERWSSIMARDVLFDFSVGEDVHNGIFGGNFLFHKNSISNDGSFDEAADQIGVEGLRYPGGAISEVLFDIRNPDSPTAIDPVSGDVVSVTPISDFLEFAIETDRPVTIVIPTRKFLTSEEDALGHRYEAVDEELLRTFVSDVLNGVYGAAKIEAFEIGNEYWGIGDFEQGSMTTLEYARVSSKMAEILDETIATLGSGQDPSVLVQIGSNNRDANLRGDYEEYATPQEKVAALEADYQLKFSGNVIYKGGDLDWDRIANEILINEYQNDGTLEAVDGIAFHVYSRAPVIESSRYRHFDTIEETWNQLDKDFELWITEWNQKSKTNALDPEEDFGLKAAHELIDRVGVFAEEDVTGAHIWAVQHNTKTALTEPQADPNLEATMNPTGEIFCMMQEHLPGTRLVDLDLSADRPFAYDGEGFEFHTFASDGKFVGYLASVSDQDVDVDLAFGNIITGWESASVTRLGVAEGDDPGDPKATPVVTKEDPEQALADGEVITSLKPFEIIQIVFEAPDYTEVFADALDAAANPIVVESEEFLVNATDIEPPDFGLDSAPAPDLPPQILTLEEETEEAEPEEDVGGSDGGGIDGMLGFLLLPLLIGLGMG